MNGKVEESTNPLHLEGAAWFSYFSGVVASVAPHLFLVVNEALASGEEIDKQKLEEAAIKDTLLQVLLSLPEDAREKLLSELRKSEEAGE